MRGGEAKARARARVKARERNIQCCYHVHQHFAGEVGSEV